MRSTTTGAVGTQMTIQYARERREDGIERASNHAGDRWKRLALGYLLEYLTINAEPFLGEDLRWFAEDRGLPFPPDGRAWGQVIRSAIRGRFIKPALDEQGERRCRPAKSSNLSLKPLWVRA